MDIRLDTLLENQIIDPGKITEVICNNVRVWKGLSENVSDLASKYTFKKFNHNIAESFNKPSYSIIVEEKESLSKDEVKKPLLNEKFPLESKDSVLKAIKYFDYVKPELEEELANSICEKMSEFGININEIDPNSKLYKLLCSKEECCECPESLKEMLLDDDDMINESFSGKESRRWRIIKNTMKFVDKNSVREAFPNLKDSSDKEIVRELKRMLEQIPEEEKKKLINLHVSKELEERLDKKGAGAASVASAGTGILGTTGSLATAGSMISSAAANVTGTNALALPFVCIMGVGMAAVGCLVSVALGGLVGSSIMLAARKSAMKKVTMMTQSEIIETLKHLPAKTEADKKSLNVKAKNALVMAEDWNPEDYPIENDGDGKGDYYIGANNEKIYKTEDKSDSSLDEQPLYFVDDQRNGNKKYTQIKKMDGKSFDSVDEVREAQNDGRLTKYTDDDGKEEVGAYEPCGHYTGIHSRRKTTVFEDPKTKERTEISNKHISSENMLKSLYKYRKKDDE